MIIGEGAIPQPGRSGFISGVGAYLVWGGCPTVSCRLLTVSLRWLQLFPLKTLSAVGYDSISPGKLTSRAGGRPSRPGSAIAGDGCTFPLPVLDPEGMSPATVPTTMFATLFSLFRPRKS